MTINLTTSLTILEGETYAATSGAVFYMAAYPDDFWFRNYGTIHATGRDVIGFLGWTVRGDFLNAGLIRVDSAGGLSYGLRFESWGPDVVNTGRIEMNGRGTAVSSWSPHQVFDNRGVVIATDLEGGGEALWFRNGAEISNTGRILAYGPAARAIFIDHFHVSLEIAPTVYRHDGYFENNGDIVAQGAGGGPTYALALSGVEAAYGASGPNVVNNGFMQADRVIWWEAGGYTPRQHAEQWVVNHGEMYGDIFLDTGDDRFISDGVYSGHLDMGEGDDQVDLSANSGLVTVDLGYGADIALGSDAVDHIEGGSGDDQLRGAGGHDYLDGAEGDDLLFGGSGDDTLVGGWQRDRLEGGDGDDLLIGDYDYPGDNHWNSGDHLLGGAGNDRLRGGQNDDYLDGGAGVDTAIFYGLRSSYTISVVDGAVAIVGLEGVDTLVDVERLDFFDGVYTIQGQLIARHSDASAGDQVISGTDGRDELRGGSGDDVMTPGQGRDLIDGGAGDDVVWLTGHRDSYKVLQCGDDFLIVNWYADPKYLTGVETVRFTEGGVLDLVRMYGGKTDADPMVLPGMDLPVPAVGPGPMTRILEGDHNGYDSALYAVRDQSWLDRLGGGGPMATLPGCNGSGLGEISPGLTDLF